MKKILGPACLSLLLSGCVVSSTMFGNGLTATSILGADGVQLRQSFLVARLTGNPSRYRAPIACNYRLQFVQTQNERRRSGSARITLNPHNNAIYSYVALNGQESTASMDNTGLVRQFNATQLDGQKLLGWQGAKIDTLPVRIDAYPVPEILMLIPQYYPGPWNPGDTVATLYNARRQPVGEYLFRGMVTGDNQITRFAALDILTGANGQTFNRETSRVIRGFAVIDLDTMLPVALSYRTAEGTDLTIQRRRCD